VVSDGHPEPGTNLSGEAPSGAGWFSLALACTALLGLIVLAVLIKQDALRGLIPRDNHLGGKESFDAYVAPIINLLTGFGFFGGGAAALLASIELVRARKRPGPRSGVPVLALLLGLVALPAAIFVFLMAAWLAAPWSFG
jgi:hypothetical protein